MCLFDVSAVSQLASLKALELSMLKDWMYQKIKDFLACFSKPIDGLMEGLADNPSYVRFS